DWSSAGLYPDFTAPGRLRALDFDRPAARGERSFAVAMAGSHGRIGSMADVEPEKVRAIRTAVALELRLDPSEVELDERSVPGGSEDEPSYVTPRIPLKPGLDDATINAAVQAVPEQAWHHPAEPW